MYNTEFTIPCKRIGNANERPHDSLNAVQESKRETPKHIRHSVSLCVCFDRQDRKFICDWQRGGGTRETPLARYSAPGSLKGREP